MEQTLTPLLINIPNATEVLLFKSALFEKTKQHKKNADIL